MTTFVHTKPQVSIAQTLETLPSIPNLFPGFSFDGCYRACTVEASVLLADLKEAFESQACLNDTVIDLDPEAVLAKLSI